MPGKKYLRLTLISFTCASLLLACDKKTGDEQDSTARQALTEDTASKALKLDQSAGQAVWQAAGQTLSRCAEVAINLNDAIDNFIASPRKASLLKAQEAWKIAALEQRKLLAFRYIALAQANKLQAMVESYFRIAAWPIQPGSLDSWGPYLYSGLVHDIGSPLSKENLLQLHGQVDSENATLGYYALEYMLFGYKGQRSVEDYQAQSSLDAEHKERGFKSVSELPNNRRRSLLQLQSDLLVNEIQGMLNKWNSPNMDSYNKVWDSISSREKYLAAKYSLENSLASLIIDIAAASLPVTKTPETSLENKPIEDLHREKPTDTEPENINPSPWTNMPQASYVANTLYSLQQITPLLDEVSQKAISTELNSALTALKLESTNNREDHSGEETGEIAWATVYQHLKKAAEELKPSGQNPTTHSNSS